MAKSDINTEYHRYMQEAKGRGVRDVNKMAQDIQYRVDLDDMSRDELEYFYIRAIVASKLTYDDFRSVVWGGGIYVNPNDCDMESLVRVFNSSKRAQRAKEKITSIWKKLTIKRGVPGQYEIDFTDGTYKPQISDEELLQRLLDDIAI